MFSIPYQPYLFCNLFYCRPWSSACWLYINSDFGAWWLPFKKAETYLCHFVWEKTHRPSQRVHVCHILPLFPWGYCGVPYINTVVKGSCFPIDSLYGFFVHLISLRISDHSNSCSSLVEDDLTSESLFFVFFSMLCCSGCDSHSFCLSHTCTDPKTGWREMKGEQTVPRHKHMWWMMSNGLKWPHAVSIWPCLDHIQHTTW